MPMHILIWFDRILNSNVKICLVFLYFVSPTSPPALLWQDAPSYVADSGFQKNIIIYILKYSFQYVLQTLDL